MNVCVWIYHLTCKTLTQTHTHTQTRMDARTHTHRALLNHWVGRHTVPEAHIYTYICTYFACRIYDTTHNTTQTKLWKFALRQRRRRHRRSMQNCSTAFQPRASVRPTHAVLFGTNVCDNNNNLRFARTHTLAYNRIAPATSSQSSSSLSLCSRQAPSDARPERMCPTGYNRRVNFVY